MSKNVKSNRYTPEQTKELEKINKLPSKGKDAHVKKFAEKYGKTPSAVYFKLGYMIKGRSNKTGVKKRKYTRKGTTVATVMPKTEPVISGRTVEIKGIKSISFVGTSLLFNF